MKGDGLVIGVDNVRTLLLGGVIALGGACTAESGDELGFDELRLVELVGGAACVDLYAGQSIVAGRVCVTIDDAMDTSTECGAGATGAMVVTYSTSEGWELAEAHLAAGDELSDIPTNKKGNPKIGHFPHSSGPLDGATSYEFVVPLCEFGLDSADIACEPVTAFLAAHAVVRSNDDGQEDSEMESAWAEGQQLNESGSWAQYFTMMLDCTVD